MGICEWGTDQARLISPVSCNKSIVFVDNTFIYADEVAANATPEERSEFIELLQAKYTAHEMWHNIGLYHHRVHSADGLDVEYGGDEGCFMRYSIGFDQFHGITPWPDIFTTLPHCAGGNGSDPSIPNESCWGQIQVSDADTLTN